MQKITLFLDLPEMTVEEKTRLREEIGGVLLRVWPRATWLWAIGEPPTDDMAKGLIGGAWDGREGQQTDGPVG